LNFKAVIFDLDGTLLDTLEDIADSMNIVLRSFNFPKHDVAAYKYFIGNGLEALVARAIPEKLKDDSILQQCIVAMREEYGKRWANKTRPYKGIPELLDSLALRGIKMAILSNKPDEFTKTTVANLLPHWQFELVLGAKPSAPKKPDPTTAKQMSKSLNISPTEFLFLGDTAIDMETAKAAGMYPVGALWGFGPAHELSAGGAKLLIEKPGDFLEL